MVWLLLNGNKKKSPKARCRGVDWGIDLFGEVFWYYGKFNITTVHVESDFV